MNIVGGLGAGFVKRLPPGRMNGLFVQACEGALKLVWISMVAGAGVAGLFGSRWVEELALDRAVATERAAIEKDWEEADQRGERMRVDLFDQRGGF